MNTANTQFNSFAQDLVRKQINPETLRLAKAWYKQFAGTHAVKMEDRDLVEIYQDLH